MILGKHMKLPHWPQQLALNCALADCVNNTKANLKQRVEKKNLNWNNGYSRIHFSYDLETRNRFPGQQQKMMYIHLNICLQMGRLFV